MSTVRVLQSGDIAEWLRMRLALWPDCSRAQHNAEMASLMRDTEYTAVFVSPRPNGGLRGFLELTIRPLSDAWKPGRMGYVEGWYVDPDMRRCGIGGALVRAAETWAWSRGCSMMGSDTEIDNTASQAAHQHLGYHETERLVHFQKPLTGQH